MIKIDNPSTTDHSALSNLDYSSAGHTGFQSTVTSGNITESTSAVLKIIGGTAAIMGTGVTVEVIQASATTSGYLSNTDWSTFNGKLSAESDTLATVTSRGTTTSSNLTFNGTLTLGTNIKSLPHQWHVSIVNPNAVVTASAIIPICALTDAALTITKIEVTTSSASYEVAGDLKWADARIGLGNAAVIETFDTTSGVRSDSSIASGSVASGKFVYLSFDSAPSSSMTDVVIDIYWDYD